MIDEILEMISGEAKLRLKQRTLPRLNRPTANQHLGAERALRELHSRIIAEIKPKYEQQLPKGSSPAKDTSSTSFDIPAKDKKKDD